MADTSSPKDTTAMAPFPLSQAMHDLQLKTRMNSKQRQRLWKAEQRLMHAAMIPAWEHPRLWQDVGECRRACARSFEELRRSHEVLQAEARGGQVSVRGEQVQGRGSGLGLHEMLWMLKGFLTAQESRLREAMGSRLSKAQEDRMTSSRNAH